MRIVLILLLLVANCGYAQIPKSVEVFHIAFDGPSAESCSSDTLLIEIVEFDTEGNWIKRTYPSFSMNDSGERFVDSYDTKEVWNDTVII